MDEIYDYIFLGTGLTECVLSGIFSATEKAKVLQMDRNSYYGGEATSMNLDELYKNFGRNAPPEHLGRVREWNVDLVPKFLMADGKLVKLLVSTGVTRYLEFKSANASYVYKDQKIHKVPGTQLEALSSKLMGVFEKRRFAKFLSFVDNFEEDNPTTHDNIDPATVTSRALFASFSLGANTQAFIGHAMALYRNDDYLNEPCGSTIAKIRLYINSFQRYGVSPYLYPMYGLGELPQGFARLSAVYGGTYMLNKPIDKVERKEDDLIHVTSEGCTVKAKVVVGDPSYFPDRVHKIGEVVRAICILSHPIPNTAECSSCQIIIPQSQVKRKHDIYVFCVSGAHQVCVKGKYLAQVSTVVETDKPEDELAPGLQLLGAIDEKFIQVSSQFAPNDDGSRDKIYVSRSYDATTHFESTCDDIIDLYKRIIQKEFDFANMKSDVNSE